MNRITAGYVSALWAHFECNVNVPRVVCIFDTFGLTPKGRLLPAVMIQAFCDKWQRCGRTRMWLSFEQIICTYFSFVTTSKYLQLCLHLCGEYCVIYCLLGERESVSTADVVRVIIN